MSPFVRRRAVRHTDRVLARSSFALVLALLIVTLPSGPRSDAQQVQHATAEAIARLELALPEESKLESWAASDSALVQVGEEGRLYASRGIGVAFLSAPLHGVARLLSEVAPRVEAHHTQSGGRGRFFAGLVPGVLGALLLAGTSFSLVLAVRRLGVSRKGAWFAGLTYALSTFAWPAARSALPETAGAFLLMVAFHLTLRVRERYERLEFPRWPTLLCMGFVLGLAWLVDPLLRPAVLVLGATAEVALARGQRILATSRWTPRGRWQPRIGTAVAFVLLPILFAILLQGYLDHLRYGSWLDPVGLRRGWSGEGGGLELFLSPGQGLLFAAPLLLLFPSGLARTRAEGERLYPRTLLLLSIAILLPAMALADPAGVLSYGPRRLLPLLPFLWIGVGLAFDGATSTRLRLRAIGGLALLGFVIQLPSTLVHESTAAGLVASAGPEDEADWERRAVWRPGCALPWLHWRILRHRVAGLDEEYSSSELLGVEPDRALFPAEPEDQGFRQLAWYDLSHRLEGSALWGALLGFVLMALGVVSAVRGLDPSQE